VSPHQPALHLHAHADRERDHTQTPTQTDTYVSSRIPRHAPLHSRAENLHAGPWPNPPHRWPRAQSPECCCRQSTNQTPVSRLAWPCPPRHAHAHIQTDTSIYMHICTYLFQQSDDIAVVTLEQLGLAQHFVQRLQRGLAVTPLFRILSASHTVHLSVSACANGMCMYMCV
jgi:hypothetical protein